MLESSVRINFICHVLMIHATRVEKVLLFDENTINDAFLDMTFTFFHALHLGVNQENPFNSTS